jgi:branched-chain amino acid transport system substrate-binding protein
MVLLLVGLSACAQDQSTGGATFSNPNPITIGVSEPLSGDFASDGKASLQAYQLWVDKVNNAGGLLGRQVKLVFLNDRSDPVQTTKDYETLISKDRVDLLVGPYTSLLTKAAMKAKGISQYAFIEGSGGAPSVFNPGWPNLFDVSIPVVNNLVTYAEYILSLPRSIRPKTAAYLTSDNPFTWPQVKLARDLLIQGGIRDALPYMQYTEGDAKAPAAGAEKIVRSKADIVILGTLLSDMTAEIGVFKKDHYNPRSLIATTGPDLGQAFIKGVGGAKYTEGIFVPNAWYPQADNYQNAEMVQAYLAKYGGTVDQISSSVGEAFSVGQVLQAAATRINSIDNSKLVAELHSGEVFNTVLGTAKFDNRGRNTLALAYLFQWQKGRYIPVYPLSVAVENPESGAYTF